MGLDYLTDLLYGAALFAINFASMAAPYAGLIAGFSILMFFSISEEKKGARVFWSSTAATALLVGPVAFFLIPWFMLEQFGIDSMMPQWQLIAHCAGGVAGLVIAVCWLRWGQQWLNKFSHGLTRRTAMERNRRTDVREIGAHLPESKKAYDPTKYLEKDPRKGKGLFLGLNEKDKPVYVPYEQWRKSHVQVIGTTGAGKGVASAVLLSQALRAGEAVFVLDPKDDEWAPHVLKAEAERAGVPFHLIDLRGDFPQLDLLAEMQPSELEELFISGFSLAEKGEAADFYRIGDRKAARNISALVAEGMRDIYQIASDKRTRSVHDTAAGFLGKLEELALLTSINAKGGLNLAETIRGGGCVYIIGSMRHSRVIMAQRMLFVRLLQLVEKRDRIAGPVRPVCVFLDEVKYHLSRPALEGLGAARDKGMHLVLAHQSLGDLRDCPADLDPEAVVGAVVENCGLRVAYRVKNPETAEWLAQMSGEILVDDESRRVDRNIAGSEVMEHERSIRQATRYLVDVNMLLNLPDRTAVLYGVGLPQFAHICPIKSEKKALDVHKAPVLPPFAPAVDEKPAGKPKAVMIARASVTPIEPRKPHWAMDVSETPSPPPVEQVREPEQPPQPVAKPKKDIATNSINLEDLDDLDI